MSERLTDDHLSLLERALANIGGSHYTEADGAWTEESGLAMKQAARALAEVERKQKERSDG